MQARLQHQSAFWCVRCPLLPYPHRAATRRPCPRPLRSSQSGNKHLQKAFSANSPRLIAVAKAESADLMEQLQQVLGQRVRVVQCISWWLARRHMTRCPFPACKCAMEPGGLALNPLAAASQCVTRSSLLPVLQASKANDDLAVILAEETTGKVGGLGGVVGLPSAMCRPQGSRPWGNVAAHPCLQLHLVMSLCTRPAFWSSLQRLIDYYGIKLEGKKLVLMVEDPKVRCATLCCAVLH